MKGPARILLILLLATFTAHPGRADIIVNWLGAPIDLSTDLLGWQQPLDINGDSLVDFVFGVNVTAVSVQGSGGNQYLIAPSPPPNIGGPVAPVGAGFEIGPNSGNVDELDWYNSNPFYSDIVIGLSGPDGFVLIGAFVGQRAYMGISFDIGGDTHYGWIDMYVSDIGPGALIYGWGYESDPNTSILAGVVPEPSTIILFATGSLALLYTRAKKRIR